MKGDDDELKSRLQLIEAEMKERDNGGTEYHDIYFGNNAVIHYQSKPDDYLPLIAVGMKKEMSEEAVLEFMRGCKGFTSLHKELFGIEVQPFVTTEKEFMKVKDWWKFFLKIGLYR